MKSLLAVTLALTTSIASAQTPAHDYPSCNIRAQHALTGDMGGSMRSAGQTHISARANILEADLGNAQKAGRLTRARSEALYTRVEAVRHATDAHVRKHHSLSARMRANDDRQLDTVAAQFCHA